MQRFDRLLFGFGKKLPVILQTESAECGLACLAMIAGYHGHHISLASVRHRYSVSLKGTGLRRLIEIAEQLEFAARPLKLDMGNLRELRLPSILHWDFNHFVVLESIKGDTAIIHDPARGVCRLTLDALSLAFTGVALELWPSPQFETRAPVPSVKLRDLVGRLSGLGKSIAVILTLAFALEVIALVQPFYLQWVIDEVLVSFDRNLLTLLGIGFSLLIFIHTFINGVRAWALMYFGSTLSLQWRTNVFAHLLKLPVQYFERRHLGDIVSRFGAIDTIQQTLTTSFLSAVIDGLLSVITLVMMFVYSPLLSTVSLSAILIYAGLRWAWYGPLRNASEEHIVRAAKQQSHFLESMRGVKVIKLFNRQTDRRSSWMSLLASQLNADVKVQKLQIIYQNANALLFGIEGIAIIWIGAAMVLRGALTVGMLMAYHAYKLQFSSRVSSLIDKFFEVKMLRLQGDRLADIVFSKPELEASENGSLERVDDIPASVTFDEVVFRYAEGEPTILNGVSFEVAAGESVAIVGPSGCGKTTLANVLLGVLEPTQGQVRVGGIDIKQLGLSHLRSLVGTVLQDDVLFAGSIAENISFFDPSPDQEWLLECARLAAIHSDIVGMPMGYNTLVGDMGTVLSGGQKQRLLLARALYKRPKILVLDEATSHLDIQRERQVNLAVGAMSMTRLIIAHRPETIASASRVITLSHGRVLATDGGIASPARNANNDVSSGAAE